MAPCSLEAIARGLRAVRIPNQESKPVLVAGTLVGPYRILAPLGVGGMGEVYLAHDARLERDVALKFLAPSLGGDEETRVRFARETRAVARLDHPNIVTLHEVGDYQGQPYLVMQYVAGRSLAEFARGRQLTCDTVLDLGVQLCAGLQAAHEQGIVHRDVKPSNILIDSRLRARLADFGLARIGGEAQLTSAGALPGTLGYVAPEVVLGEEADARSDVFSLGVVLYELLAGCLPFPAGTAPAYVYAVVHERPEPLGSRREGLPAGLEAVMDRALAKDRVLRYATAAECGADLRRLLQPAGGVEWEAKQRPSIAVLPFEDMSPGRDQEYLCDGIAEELMQVLTRIEGLRVVARTSAFAFKGSRADVREIGRKLGVQTLLAGSVRKAGDRVRIGVQLVDARDGSHLWAESYDRQLEDIFAVQDEVCLAAAEWLKLTLLERGKTGVGRRLTQDATAYTLYLKGRFLFYQRSAASMEKCVQYFTQAIERDPRFALAHAGLAEVYESLGSWRVMPREAAYAQARRAAQTAVELDDRLPEGHEALATIRMFCDWDWAGAAREYERALAINPACVEAHHMYAHWHEAMGLSGRALAEMRAALELEPVAPALHSCFAEILFHARRYDETVRQCGLTLEMAPGFAGVYGWAGMAHVLAGRIGAGLEALREGLERRPGDPRLEALQGTAQAMAGRKDEARASVERLDAIASQKYVDPYFRTWPHVVLGEPDQAFALLTKARDEHSQWIYLLKVDPLLDGLRSDPRFGELRGWMGLPA